MTLRNAKLYMLSFFVVFAVCSVRAQDQSQYPPSGQAQKSPAEQKEHRMGAKHVTVTGCLQKGDEANEYAITGEDGKKYGLFSSKVKLSEHLGHKVTVTGKPRKEAGKMEAGEKGDLTVTDLKMVSESCQ